MPQPNERHAKSKWEWGSEPARSQQDRDAVTEPEHKRPPGKKNTKLWCKGHEGRPHQLAITLDGRYRTYQPGRCRWYPRWEWREKRYVLRWTCVHQETCTACGKVLRYQGSLGDADCPAYPGDGKQKAEALAQALEWQERRNRISLRKPVITGPTHYRRQR